MKIFTIKHLPHLLIFIFAFLLYGNTINNDYALDDLIVIKDNSFTKKGISGISEIFRYDSFTGFFGVEKKLVAGGRYRPLSLASFAVEYALTGGLNPHFSHLLNILFYALTGIFLFMIFSKLLKTPPGKPWHLGVPFIAVMLFMAHPVHTEVVANIKGRDEIFALLFPLISLWLTIRYFEHRKISWLLLANVCFFLGLLSKENAIMFVAIIPLTVYFFTKVAVKDNIITSLSFLFTAILFVFIRFLVLGYLNSGELPKELLNNPFLDATQSEKFGTIFFTLGLYVKLLFLPHPLTHDYYPYHIPLVPITDWKAIVSLAIYIVLIGYVVMKFKSKDIIAYGILFYLLTLFIVSNLLFSVGTFMNERFIYMPSVGFAVIIAWLFVNKLPLVIKNGKTLKQTMTWSLLIILVLFSIRTYTRNFTWKDNFTLFTTDVLTSENSIKCNISAGGDYQKKALQETDPVKKEEDYQLSMKYLEKALSIYPTASNGLLLYGNVLSLYKQDQKQAIIQYMKVLESDPYNRNAFTNTILVLGSLDNVKESTYKVSVLKHLYAINPEDADLNYNLGKIYGQFRANPDSACYFLERAISLNSGNIAAYKDLGIVYGMKGEYDKALDVLSRAQKLDPSDRQIVQNIMITRQLMDQQKK
jgi:protein O-mannosyl-transferase